MRQSITVPAVVRALSGGCQGGCQGFHGVVRGLPGLSGKLSEGCLDGLSELSRACRNVSQVVKESCQGVVRGWSHDVNGFSQVVTGVVRGLSKSVKGLSGLSGLSGCCQADFTLCNTHVMCPFVLNKNPRLSVEIMANCCQGVVRALSGVCQGIFRVLSGICQGIVRVLSGVCQGIVRRGLSGEER